ncbi:Negative regulator of mitosis [Penicillium diatomitis]|uniref:Negative regulator of mitosis n=1 Tax=Penicillium diatomitis TaxID=2819901 RepID=A0A9W9WL55_9EURO|nr:Negative regulator of mitosis [Penicillium diatomitis]KAJ5469499.1 Negative regulator of mitosis [Penicillium diatomitis]
MATTRSLGVHEPSAISYLVAEGFLPLDPPRDHYKWTTCADESGSAGPVDDELVWTKHCVVWSRAGVVKRVFRFDPEKEDVRHALFTHFVAGDTRLPKHKDAAGSASKKHFAAHATTKSRSKVAPKHDGLASSLPGSGSTLDPYADTHTEIVAPPNPGEKRSRALVVVLKSQAHIFFVAGNTHTIPLPFEVESVFATPRGLLFQRKIVDDAPQPRTSCPPPPNSFMTSASLFDPGASQSSNTVRPAPSKGKRQSLKLPSIRNSTWGASSQGSTDIPRVFSLIDPHSEMGLVVTSSASRGFKSSIGSGASRRQASGLEALDSTDEIVYISAKDELAGAGQRQNDTPLILVVTTNTVTGLYTIWTARYRDDVIDGSKLESSRRQTEGTRSKRRSSHFGMTPGTTTPVARPPTSRESFGPWTEHWASSQQGENRNNVEEDLVSRVAQDFGDIGVPLKTSRRVSSLLARTDLATSQDRITFSDLATGSQSGGTAHHGTFRQSMGAGSTRASFGYNPRSSLPPGTGSVYSAAGSFMDSHVDRLLEETNGGALTDGFGNIALRESASGLPEELLLTKVESFSTMFSGNFRGSFEHASSRNLRISTLSSSESSTQNGNLRFVAVCVVDRDSRNMTIVNLKAEQVAVSKSKKAARKFKPERRPLLVHAIGVQYVPNVWDACTVKDGGISRILTLSVAEDGHRELCLQTPWSSPSQVEIPCPLQMNEPHGVSASKLVIRPRESGVNRVMADPSLVFEAFDHSCSRGKIDLVDTTKQRHRLQIRMEPRNELIQKILKVCNFVLRDTGKAGDGILVAWWEVVRWLQGREDVDSDLEWAAIVIVLFSLATPFIQSPQPQAPVRRTRRKRNLLRSSSGSYIDLESWEAMLDLEGGSSGVVAPWMKSSAWNWIVEQDAISGTSARVTTRQPKGEQPGASRTTYRPNSYLLRCASLSREFLQSPSGARAIGKDGYLPISGAFADSTRGTALGTILIGLHLLREERKLCTSDSEDSQQPLGLLGPVLAQLGGWLGWQSWNWTDNSYYGTEMASMERWQFEDTRITELSVPAEPFAPPSIFDFLARASSQDPPSFLSLLDVLNAQERASRKDKLWKECFLITPRTLALIGFFSDLRRATSPLDKIQLLRRWGLNKSVIDSFPEGVSGPLYETVMQCQNEASTSWHTALLEIIDREDLYMSMNPAQAKSFAHSQQPVASHDAFRDHHNIGTSALEFDTNVAFEASAEADRLAVTKLVFREDRRYIDASRLLNQSKAPVAECVPEPQWTDSDLLEAQKDIVQLVSFRTLSIPAGRGMLYFSGRLPLLTEKLPIPSFSLQCVMKPSNVTVSADRSAFTEEKVCWAFFHNGVSTGLAISKASKGIDTSWILFNKPQDLTNRHAGFLLALGLNGHLKSLAKWVAFKYLTPKHTMTSIGLLLGLSASYIGTMDTLITRLLSVHVSRMLPMGAAELNLSPLTQTAGIMGIGLLYCGSQHRRMSEVMLSEIESTEQEEHSASQEDLRDEGYRLAAGFALGLINLAKGKDLQGMRDMHVVERLLSIAAGTKNVDLAHVLDRATAGATIAITLIFMKTNDSHLAQKIDIPDTTVRFDYVRPDLFLLRTLARHLIMWDSIRPEPDWVDSSLPPVYRRRARLRGIRQLQSEDMPFFNILGGICFALGLRYAGSGNTQARDLLIYYLDQFIRISRLPVVSYDGRLTRNSVRNCQDIVSLSAAAVMAGTGDLLLFRRLRSLHGRVDPDTPYGSHMAAHMAIGMLFLGGGSYTLGSSDLGVAALLCALYPIFPTTVLDNKCHLQAFRHMWVLAAEPRCIVPRDLDNRRPISIPITLTTRTGAIFSLTAPCLLPDPSEITRVDVRGPDHWPLVLDFNQDHALREKFRRGDPSVYLRRKATYSSAGDASSVFASTLTGLSEAQDILPATAAAGASSAKGLPPSLWPNQSTLLPVLLGAAAGSSQSPWDWVFALPSLRGLDIRERSLVLPSSFPAPSNRINAQSVTAPPWLRTSAVDTRLALAHTVRNIVQAAHGLSADADEIRDRVWQLRILFEWLDRVQSDEAEKSVSPDALPQSQNQTSGLWLRRDFLEEARWQILGVQNEDYGVGMDGA